MIAFHFPELHIRDILSWKNCNIKTKKCSNKKCINLRSSGGPKAIYLFGSESFKIVFFWAWSMFRCSTLFFWCDDAHWVEKPFWKSIHICHALGILWIFLLYSYCKAISVLKEPVYFVDSFNFLEQYTIFQNNNKISMRFKTEIPLSCVGILPRENKGMYTMNIGMLLQK